MPGRMSLSQQYWHLGFNNSLWLCICRELSSVPGLHPPDANSILAPNSDHQTWLQPLPTSPGGKITPNWKTLLYNMTRNLDADPLKQQISLSMNIKSTSSDFLNAKFLTLPAHLSTLSLWVPTVTSHDVFYRDHLLKPNQRQQRGEWKLSPGTSPGNKYLQSSKLENDGG